jgi:gamma-glutamylcyclotransferase (GGCT)/AIG2-like uncharacterized protein YtfP
MKERYVFVYGTLRQGGSNDITRLQPAPRFVGHSSVRGWLYNLGDYPGLRLDESAHAPIVLGEIYAITSALEHLLDVIEGVAPVPNDEYLRREIQVSLNGEWLPCLIYELAASHVQNHALLVHGDWMRRDR